MNRRTIDIIESAVTVPAVLELHGVKLRGSRCRCPIHHGDRLSFSFNDKVYHCFNCNASGGPIQLEAELSGVSQDEACRILAKEFGLDITYRPLTEQEEKDYELNNAVERSYKEWQKEKGTYYRGLTVLFRSVLQSLREDPEDQYLIEMRDSLEDWLDDNIQGVQQPWIFQPSQWTISLMEQSHTSL